MKYAVDCVINETLFIDADDKEEAASLAIIQMEENYDVVRWDDFQLGQVEVVNIEEI